MADWTSASTGSWLAPTAGAPGPSFQVPTSKDISQVFHIETRLAEHGLMGLLVDPGSIGNLAGETWAVDMATDAVANSRKPDQYKRERPLKVSGVGSGSQVANHNVVLPICCQQLSGNHSSGSFETATVRKSGLPGIIGLASLTNRRAILDMNTKQLHFCGPGDYDLVKMLPPGTESFQLKEAPSGHLLLPCNHYKSCDKQQMTGSLTLDSAPLALASASAAAPVAAPKPKAKRKNAASARGKAAGTMDQWNVHQLSAEISVAPEAGEDEFIHVNEE